LLSEPLELYTDNQYDSHCSFCNANFSTGNGLAMRAAATLKLLTAWAPSVHLLVIPMYETGQEPDPQIADLCTSWQMVPDPTAALAQPKPSATFKQPNHGSTWLQPLNTAGLSAPGECLSYNADWQDKITSAIASMNPDLIVVFRFYLAQFVVPAFARTVPIWLDIDELESKARSRLAAVYGLAGDRQKGAQLALEAQAYQNLEWHHLPSFKRIFAASNVEAKSVLTACTDADVRVLTNIYPRILPQPAREADGKFRFLYVGTFGYFPNCDAITHFVVDILPHIQRRSSLPVEVFVIGTGLTATGENPSVPGVNVIGAVPDTTPFYADCDATIVPLRSGGGTRIKILEAFSHQRAIVSTSLGAEGLEVTSGIHLHIADGAPEFAGSCLRLIENASERNALAKRGHEFFKEHHTARRLEALLPELFSR
jgi:glycosyltransferase involved in cell wall biosynthesis